MTHQIVVLLSLLLLSGSVALAHNSSDISDKKDKKKKTKTIQAARSIYIDLSPDELWKITALDFGRIDKWSAGVNKSDAGGDGADFEGAVCTERVCDPSYKGFKETTERFVDFNEKEQHFTYKIARGLPGFVTYGQNKWTHAAKGKGTELTMTVTMEVKGLMGSIMKGPMKKNMSKLLLENLEELKVYAETGEQHPRKKAAMAKYKKEMAKKKKKNS